MVKRARLTATKAAGSRAWPWHHAKWTALSVNDLSTGDRRLEAENFLMDGHGIRLSMERRPTGWKRLSHFAHTWLPNRLKAVYVDPEAGTPFLTATQVFDVMPNARKWLALERTAEANSRFVEPGAILITRSGAVGRVTVAHEAHRNTIISDDLLRVDLHQPRLWGWIYAFLRSPQALAMMTGSRYGHIIKHLEPSHLDALPVPEISEDIALHFEQRVSSIIELRTRAYDLTRQAYDIFSNVVGDVVFANETGFVRRSSAMFLGRRRLEASFHAPRPTAILERFRELGLKIEDLSAVTKKVWWMSRFKRYYGEGGIPYLSADELFSINPIANKKILVSPEDRHDEYFVDPGWIIMACSGQIYGLNGSSILATEHHSQTFFSHDLIRIIPESQRIRSGYLLAALSHPELGRPLLIKLAYGTSIPHLEPTDVSCFPVVRMANGIEEQIADLVEESAKMRDQADAEERLLKEEAERFVDDFISGESLNGGTVGLALVGT